MNRRRSSGKGLWVALVILLLAALGVGAYISIRGARRSEAPATPPEAANAPLNPIAVDSWKNFVHEARARCEKEPGCSLDYAAVHQVGDQSFGVIVTAWKDSEYSIDLLRYDPQPGSWVAAPTKKTDSGMEEIDTSAASKAWSVPQALLDDWIAQAQSSMTKKYGGG